MDHHPAQECKSAKIFCPFEDRIFRPVARRFRSPNCRPSFRGFDSLLGGSEIKKGFNFYDKSQLHFSIRQELVLDFFNSHSEDYCAFSIKRHFWVNFINFTAKIGLSLIRNNFFGIKCFISEVLFIFDSDFPLE